MLQIFPRVPWPNYTQKLRVHAQSHSFIFLKLGRYDVALCMQVLPRLFKLWPWVDLDPFYAKVKFGHIGFSVGKSENYYFLETIIALGLIGVWSIQLNELMKLMSIKGQVIFWPWSKVTQISKLNLVFHRNSWAIWSQSSYESLRENGNEKLYKWVGSHSKHGRHAHIW